MHITRFLSQKVDYMSIVMSIITNATICGPASVVGLNRKWGMGSNADMSGI